MPQGQGHIANTTFAPKGAWQSDVSASEKCLGYDAFGSLLPGRNYSSSSYSRGFNGQLKDDEVFGSTGTSYTAEFWQYDPRVARRWNLDPVPQVGISDYAAFGLNPITNVDPNGAYFFGLFGSTSKQRQAADDYVQEHGGAVIDRHRKRISVAYQERFALPGAGREGFGVVMRQQGFELDGSLSATGPTLKTPTVDWADAWRELQPLSYDIMDKGYLAYQATPINTLIGDLLGSPNTRSHIDGSHADQSEVEGGLFDTGAMLIPAGKGAGLIKKLNAAQFSSLTKGTFIARAPAATRGLFNRLTNKAVNWVNGAKAPLLMLTNKVRNTITDDEPIQEEKNQ